MGTLTQVTPPAPDLFIAALGAAAQEAAFPWLATLNRAGITAEMDFSDKSLKSQMKRADKLGARHVLILGDDELAQGTGQLRDMAAKTQQPIELARAAEELARRLRP